MTIYGTKNNDTIDAADGVTNGIDTIYGLDGKDTIYGLGGDDIMKGGGGADTFYGGPGIDEVTYGDSLEQVYIDLDVGRGWAGTADGDLFHSIENVTGSLYNDGITGNSGDNTLRGWDGSDTLYGDGGADILEGGAGIDHLEGGSFGDRLYGGEDDDYLQGGEGADQLFGGGGFDSASYVDSPEPVVVSLLDGVAYEGDAAGDTFDSIEELFGSNFDDHLYGDDGDNDLYGMGGNDTLKGYGGNDYLFGGLEADTLIGGDGLDTLYGEAGADRFVWTKIGQTGVTMESADVIGDFHPGQDDRIVLSGIDADIYADGDQAFTFIGTQDFTLNLATPSNTDVIPGEIRYYHDGVNTYIELQTGDNPNADGVIRLEGIVDPQASWFVL